MRQVPVEAGAHRLEVATAVRCLGTGGAARPGETAPLPGWAVDCILIYLYFCIFLLGRLTDRVPQSVVACLA